MLSQTKSLATTDLKFGFAKEKRHANIGVTCTVMAYTVMPIWSWQKKRPMPLLLLSMSDANTTCTEERSDDQVVARLILVDEVGLECELLAVRAWIISPRVCRRAHMRWPSAAHG